MYLLPRSSNSFGQDEKMFSFVNAEGRACLLCVRERTNHKTGTLQNQNKGKICILCVKQSLVTLTSMDI